MIPTVNKWPIRTRFRMTGSNPSPFGRMMHFRCDLGHQWGSNSRRESFCFTCVSTLAYSLERFAAAIGNRPKIGKFPHLPTDGVKCCGPTMWSPKEESSP